MFDTLHKWEKTIRYFADVRVKSVQTRLEQAGYLGGSSTLGNTDPVPSDANLAAQIGHLQKLQPLKSVHIFATVPSVNTVIKKKVSMMCNAKLRLYRTDTRTGEAVEISPSAVKKITSSTPNILAALLSRPSSYMTITELIEKLLTWKEITGVGYLAIDKDEETGEYSLMVLETIYVRIQPGRNTKTKYYIYNVKGNTKYFEDWQVCDLSQLNPLDFYFPMTSMAPAYRLINAELNTDIFLENDMRRGHMPAGVVTNPNNVDGPEFERMRQEWSDRWPGASRMLLPPEGVEIEQWQDPSLGEFVKTISAETLDTIAGVYEMHPAIFHQLGTSLTQGVITEAETFTWNSTLKKELIKVAEMLTLKFAQTIGGANFYFEWDFSGITALQANDLNDTKVDVADMNTGAMSINERRKKKGRKPVTGKYAEFAEAPIPAWQAEQAQKLATSKQSADSTSNTSHALPMPGNEGGRRDQSQAGEPEMIDHTGKRSFKSMEEFEAEIAALFDDDSPLYTDSGYLFK